MAVTRFDLVTQWRLDAPVADVWEALIRVENWPQWWKAVAGIEVIAPGGVDGVGTVRRITWRTALPYTLAFEMRTTRIEKPHVIEGRASGELDGTGRWTLSADGAGTLARYDWQVDVTKRWMRALAPLLRPVFVWNHHVVMGWGEDGLRGKLSAGRGR